MNSKSKQFEIRNEAFTKAREKLGLSIKDLASQACLSVRQIEQIENGEMSSFYGVQIKLTAAKKVARLLGLSEEEAINYGDLVVEPQKDIATTSDESNKLVVAETKQNPASEQKQSKKMIEVKPAFTSSALRSTAPAQRPKKKIFIWLSLIAVIVFSVLNLQPLFFADKPEEIVIMKEEVVEQPPEDVKVVEAAPVASTPMASPLAAQAVGEVAAMSEACPAADTVASSYKPPFPRKPADLVYVQTKTKQVICVVDASGKTQNKIIEPGVGASFYGNPPFKILSSGLAQLDIYFQGAKVRPANLDGKTIVLEAGDISQPASSSDSQLR